jgi:diguanylate cyclase (GGDEF)-like protein
VALLTTGVLAVAYGLSRTRHTTLAAALTIGAVSAATFWAVAINPTIELLPAFLILGGLMSSLFLSPRATALVFAVSLAGVALLPALLPAFPITDIVNALFFLLTVSALTLIAAAVRQNDLRHIERQAQVLTTSEARLRAAAQSEKQANDQLRATVGQLAQRTEELGLLAAMAETLQACLTAEEAYAAVARSAQRLFPALRGALFVYSPSRNDLETQAVWGGLALAGQERTFTPEQCWALRRGRPHYVVDVRIDALCQHLQAQPPHGYLCMPLMAQGDALGVLHLQLVAAPAAQGAVGWNGHLVEAAADQIGLALANVRLRETLRNQSIRDPLTGLYNRRYMEETLEREMRRSERSGRPLSIIMLDLDHFKAINDTHGHAAGDVLLRDLGAFLRSRIRGGDIACRYGGEEFTLVLPETSLPDTRDRAEHLRQGIHDITVQHLGQTLETVTASLGVAEWQPGLTTEQVLRAADQALYRAKAEGRDRVAAAP